MVKVWQATSGIFMASQSYIPSQETYDLFIAAFMTIKTLFNMIEIVGNGTLF